MSLITSGCLNLRALDSLSDNTSVYRRYIVSGIYQNALLQSSTLGFTLARKSSIHEVLDSLSRNSTAFVGLILVKAFEADDRFRLVLHDGN